MIDVGLEVLRAGTVAAVIARQMAGICGIPADASAVVMAWYWLGVFALPVQVGCRLARSSSTVGPTQKLPGSLAAALISAAASACCAVLQRPWAIS